MQHFTYKEVYSENGKNVLELNVLPEKYCNFDCIFCPLGRTHNKTDRPHVFADRLTLLPQLQEILRQTRPDLVFINSKGEALLNASIRDIIRLIHAEGAAVRLLSNGYLLGTDPYRRAANSCDEVMGEIKMITEETFQKAQRPLDGYTLEQHISHLAAFAAQYPGKFILRITLLKGYNDDEQSLKKLQQLIAAVAPDQTLIEKEEDPRFLAKLGITEKRYKEICARLLPT